MASIRKPYTGPEPECDATAATMARKQRGASKAQLEYRSRHILAALERAQAAEQAPKADGKLWRCKVGKHDSAEDAEICKRAHGATRYFNRAPGYLAEEVAEALRSPASVPEFPDKSERHKPPHFAAIWRDTFKLAERANNRVTYATRADFLEAVAAHHKLVWEIGAGHVA